MNSLLIEYVSENSYNKTPDTILDLLDRGADVNAADNNGRTVLMYATDSAIDAVDRAKNVRTLVERGARCDSSDACHMA